MWCGEGGVRWVLVLIQDFELCFSVTNSRTINKFILNLFILNIQAFFNKIADQTKESATNHGSFTVAIWKNLIILSPLPTSGK